MFKMPVKRSMYSSSRPGKRARRLAQRTRIPRPVSFKDNVISCQRTFYYENWSPTTASVAGYWRYYQPALSALPSVSDFTNLFDLYKINGIKLTLRPRYDSFAGNDTTDTTLPGVTNQGGTQVHVIADADNTFTVLAGAYNTTTLNQFLENGKVKSYSGNRAINIYWKPKVGDSMSAGESRVFCPWMGTGASSISCALHGCHVFLQDTNMTGTFNQSFDVFVTYYMQFKSLK